MYDTVPFYYQKFQCTADACPDTCCAGWGIAIDEKTLKKYKRVKGPFGNRLKNSIDWKEGSFSQYHHRCAFLNEENLCDIYIEAGPHMLCRTCRNYPRHVEEYEGLREISLSLSCMEAGKLILGCQEPVRFLTKEKPGKEMEDPDFDYLLFDKLMDVRELLFRMTQDRSQPMRLRMCRVLALGHDFQNRLNRKELFETEDLLERYERPEAAERFQKKLLKIRKSPEEHYRQNQELFALFSRLEVLNASWPAYRRGKQHTLFGNGLEGYQKQKERFHHWLSENRQEKAQWEIYLEQLLMYFLFTYFLGAVYDEQAYGKVKFAVVSTMLIGALLAAAWVEQGERLPFSEVVDIAHRYSREVEHSDLNLNQMEELLLNREAFSLEGLLSTIYFE